MPSWFPSSSHRRNKPFLLLDARPLNLHLYSVEAQRDPIKLNLLTEVAIVPRDMNATLKAIDEVLSGNLPSREIVVVMNSPLIHHQVVSIPPMRGDERRRVLQREMNRAVNSSKDQDVVSFWSFGKQPEAEHVVEKVLCAQMPRHLAEAIVEVLEQKNLQPIGLTSHSQMVCHLCQDADPVDPPNVALVEANDWDGMITLFRMGIWIMERRFLIGNPTGRLTDKDPKEPMDLGQLMLEMDRAFQYFKQQFRNENIGRILVYGASRYIDAVCEALRTSFDLPVSQFIDNKNLFVTVDSPTNASQSNAESLYSIPCSVALHGRFEEYIDFLPERLRKQGPATSNRRVVGTLAIVLYCWLGIIWWMVNREATRVTGESDLSPLKLTADNQPADGKAQLTEQRSFTLAALQSQRWLQDKHGAIGALVREIAEIAPDQMRITSFQALEKGEGWEVNLEAEIHSPNGTRSQEMLTAFRTRCKSSSHLSQLRLTGVEITDSESISGENLLKNLERWNLLTFKMAGNLTYSTSRKG